MEDAGYGEEVEELDVGAVDCRVRGEEVVGADEAEVLHLFDPRRRLSYRQDRSQGCESQKKSGDTPIYTPTPRWQKVSTRLASSCMQLPPPSNFKLAPSLVRLPDISETTRHCIDLPRRIEMFTMETAEGMDKIRSLLPSFRSTIASLTTSPSLRIIKSYPPRPTSLSPSTSQKRRTVCILDSSVRSYRGRSPPYQNKYSKDGANSSTPRRKHTCTSLSNRSGNTPQKDHRKNPHRSSSSWQPQTQTKRLRRHPTSTVLR